ncbi:head maturation protease, ClpP-related [Agrobacterium sp. NPDC090273]|uniref:head maturation protease, ClpP-related n=1 Tax=Agrobacterium sp. NPDC090273 TaxID=3363919 RepID=UPI00383B8D33
MAAIVEDGKLRLSGYVGDYYFEDGFTSADVIVALSQIDAESELDVHLNSGGGVATEGAAIHALFTARPGVTNIIVEGIAASAASLIAMAGATVTMSAGSVMMIHDPSGYTFGNSGEHSKTIEALEALATSYARVYAAKSGKSPEECRDIMKAEHWYTPDQAVAEGFADATATGKAKTVAAFDYGLFAQAPKKLVALAKTKNWSMASVHPPEPATTTPAKDIKMATDKERADRLETEVNGLKDQVAKLTASADNAVKEALERRSAIMGLEEAKGREALAEHLFNSGNSVEAAKATLSFAPKADADAGEQEYQPPKRMMNAEGLNREPNGKPQAKGGLSARMDARAAKMKK